MKPLATIGYEAATQDAVIDRLNRVLGLVQEAATEAVEA